jgi:threonyl-tRNA synthetase
MKIPYMLVVGDKEMESGSVALRMRNGENPGAIPVEEFIQLALKAIDEKA